MYLLSMYQKLMFGPLDKPENKAATLRDIHGRETWVFGIVVVAALVMGIWPKPILDRSEKSVQAFIDLATGTAQGRAQEPRRARAHDAAGAHLRAGRAAARRRPGAAAEATAAP